MVRRRGFDPRHNLPFVTIKYVELIATQIGFVSQNDRVRLCIFRRQSCIAIQRAATAHGKVEGSGRYSQPTKTTYSLPLNPRNSFIL